MSSKAQIKANRRNARKSTGPKTAEGKAVVSQNAVKHGLFAPQDVRNCEKQADFDEFRAELLAGLAPVGGVESMLASRIVSLSWRLKRAERMSSEAIDVMIARVETDDWQKEQREEAGLLDPESGRPEPILGWAVIRDSSNSQVLERLLMHERRIESSLYKAMSESEKLRRLWKREEAEADQAIPKACGFEAATHRGRDAHETQGRDALATEAATGTEDVRAQDEKQSQFPPTRLGASSFTKNGYEKRPRLGTARKQSQTDPTQARTGPTERKEKRRRPCNACL